MKSLFSLLLSLAFSTAAFAQEPNQTDFVISRIVDVATDNTREMSLKSGDSAQIVLVDRTVLLDAMDVASADIIEGNPISLRLRMNRDGKAKLAKITTQLLNQQLAIILKGRLVSAPVIRSEITGGELLISGDISKELADEMVAILNKLRRN